MRARVPPLLARPLPRCSRRTCAHLPLSLAALSRRSPPPSFDVVRACAVLRLLVPVLQRLPAALPLQHHLPAALDHRVVPAHPDLLQRVRRALERCIGVVTPCSFPIWACAWRRSSCVVVGQTFLAWRVACSMRTEPTRCAVLNECGDRGHALRQIDCRGRTLAAAHR